MAPSANHEPPAKTGPAPVPDQGHEAAINELASFIQKFCDGQSYQGLKTLASDSENLRKELNETNIAYNRNLREMRQMTTDRDAEEKKLQKKIEEHVEQHKKVTAEKVAALQKLKAEQESSTALRQKNKAHDSEMKRMMATNKKQDDEVSRLNSTITKQNTRIEASSKEEKRLKQELESTKKQLAAQAAALAASERTLSTFQSYKERLTPLEDVRVTISESLDSSFKDALDLFRTFLGRELPEDILQNPKTWETLKNHVEIQRAIPLPASNSIHARQMRAIAGLAIYSRALAASAFRPTYIFTGTDTKDTLGALLEENPSQDAFVRAVLLKVMPQQQKIHRNACAQRVVEEVAEALAGWVPQDRLDTFKTRLGHLTGVLCGHWERVQKIHERVVPSFEFEDPGDWQTLPWKDAASTSNDTRTDTPPRQGNNPGQSRQQESEPPAISEDDIVKYVWPAFLAEPSGEDDDGTQELVQHGYVLTRADVQVAHEEMSRRNMRRATRESNGGTTRRRRDSAVFLSQGASDGLGVK